MPMTPALISGPGAGDIPAHAEPTRVIKKKRLVSIFMLSSQKVNPTKINANKLGFSPASSNVDINQKIYPISSAAQEIPPNLLSWLAAARVTALLRNRRAADFLTFGANERREFCAVTNPANSITGAELNTATDAGLSPTSDFRDP